MFTREGIVGLIFALIIITWGIYCIIVENLKEKPIDWELIKRGIICGILLTILILGVDYFVN